MRQGKSKHQEIIVSLGGKILIPHQGIHTSTLSCSADTETPTRWEKFTMVYCPHALDPRPVGTRKLVMLTPTYQPIRIMSTHIFLNHCYKTPHYPLQVETHGFEGCSDPLCLAKQIKLFFPTSHKTLSNSLMVFSVLLWIAG